MALDYFLIGAHVLAVVILFYSLYLRLTEEARVFQQLGYYTSQYSKIDKSYGLDPYNLFYAAACILLGLDGFFRTHSVSMHSYLSLYALPIALLHMIFQKLVAKGFKPKHSLVYTGRIKRMLWSAMIIAVLISVILTAIPLINSGSTVGADDQDFIYVFFGGVGVPPYTIPAICFALFVFTPLLLRFANFVNHPWEQSINNSFYREAEQKLKEAPFLRIVGITGSYGKTSVKNILGAMLERDFNTLVSPASVNTKLGLTRMIRETMPPSTEILVAEMGAKKKGEIEEIVDMMPPDVSVITTIIGQHLETFGSIENIISEKSKVFHALKRGGTAIVNIDDPNIANIPLGVDKKAVYISMHEPPTDDPALNGEPFIYVRDVLVHAGGSHFTIVDARDRLNPVSIPLKTSLLGEHNIFNILVAAAVALVMGAETNNIAVAVSGLQPVKNRLSTRMQGGVTILEDAFNSNPVGARAALNVLGLMPANKRIIITPGMIELGDQEESVHRIFGRQIAEVCDEVILVTSRTANIRKGLVEAGFDESKITTTTGMRDALKLIAKFGEGDVVLIENDLPDAFEEDL